MFLQVLNRLYHSFELSMLFPTAPTPADHFCRQVFDLACLPHSMFHASNIIYVCKWYRKGISQLVPNKGYNRFADLEGK